ncbi:MAG TPA: DUF6159 family protein [Terriglobales bacterium]|jgi:hypothetical protein
MFDRFSRSWELTKQSAAVLAKDKVLMMFPLLSGMATILLAVSFFVPMFLNGSIKALAEHQATPSTYLWLFLFYFCNFFVQIYFNCALMASANMALAGGRASMSAGIGIANERLGKIISWTLVATTVGIILRTLEERVGILGKVIIALLGAAWSILTYFIVPVIVFEDQSVFDGVSRSAALVKKTWGENVAKNVTFSALTFLGLLGIGVVAIMGIMIHPLVAILIGVIGFALLLTAVSAMDGIFKVALYRYAWQGAQASGFSPELIQGAFAEKKKSRFGF